MVLSHDAEYKRLLQYYQFYTDISFALYTCVNYYSYLQCEIDVRLFRLRIIFFV